MAWRRLVVGRQQQRVQAEEHAVSHHTIVTIHAGHTHLEIIQSREEGSEKAFDLYVNIILDHLLAFNHLPLY